MGEKRRIVVDTNVLVSALLAARPSPPQQIYRAIKEQRCILIISLPLLDELLDVLKRPVFSEKYGITSAVRRDVRSRLLEVSLVVSGKHKPSVVLDDPTDLKFIAAAVEGNADFLVSGDQHLLTLGRYEGIPIVTPRQFVTTL